MNLIFTEKRRAGPGGPFTCTMHNIHHRGRRSSRPEPTIDQVSGYRFQWWDEGADPGSLLLLGLPPPSLNTTTLT